MLKLNLGCGMYYKPNYVNIDKYDESVADKTLDITKLPYENESVDEIEASHIIEHFDIIKLPYLLAEWFRVLKPGGVIYIETPDLSKSTRKLRLSSYNTKKNILRFLFGIDIPGNIHKLGFTYSFLRKTLLLIGFNKIKKHNQTSFFNQKSIRISASRPLDFSIKNKKHFLTMFRWEICSRIKELNTNFLEAVENNCILPFYKISASDISSLFEKEILINLCSSFAIFNPQIAKIFLDLVPKKYFIKVKTEILDYLEKINSPSLFLSNWIKWKKLPDNIHFSLVKFHLYWGERIKKALTEDFDWKETFSFFLSQSSNHQQFFSLEIIAFSSIKYTNLGIKSFTENDLDSAEKMFKHSLRINPDNLVALWNLARLLIKQGNENLEQILLLYKKAIVNSKNRTQKRKIRKEKNQFINDNFVIKDILPIQIR